MNEDKNIGEEMNNERRFTFRELRRFECELHAGMICEALREFIPEKSSPLIVYKEFKRHNCSILSFWESLSLEAKEALEKYIIKWLRENPEFK